jgi:hypothetical protein
MTQAVQSPCSCLHCERVMQCMLHAGRRAIEHVINSMSCNTNDRRTAHANAEHRQLQASVSIAVKPVRPRDHFLVEPHPSLTHITAWHSMHVHAPRRVRDGCIYELVQYMPHHIICIACICLCSETMRGAHTHPPPSVAIGKNVPSRSATEGTLSTASAEGASSTTAHTNAIVKQKFSSGQSASCFV